MYYLPETQATKWNYNKCIFARSDRIQINVKTNEKQLSVYDDVFTGAPFFSVLDFHAHTNTDISETEIQGERGRIEADACVTQEDKHNRRCMVCREDR